MMSSDRDAVARTAVAELAKSMLRLCEVARAAPNVDASDMDDASRHSREVSKIEDEVHATLRGLGWE